jgi:hypothetical protein
MKVVLSYGLGVDSTALLLRWLDEPDSRDFDLADLLVVIAMTGDEWPQTVELVERHVLPRLCEAGVTYVQLARAGAKQKDGIAILDETANPSASTRIDRGREETFDSAQFRRASCCTISPPSATRTMPGSRRAGPPPIGVAAAASFSKTSWRSVAPWEAGRCRRQGSGGLWTRSKAPGSNAPSARIPTT